MTEQHFPDEGMTSFDTEGDSRTFNAGGDSRTFDTEGKSRAGAPQETAAPGAGGGADGAGGAGGSDNGTTDAVADDLTAAQTAVAALTNDLQRLQAEYVNYKRRVDRDRELVLENAKFTILSSLLPVLDDLDRAREHGELEGGFKAVADSLERIVASQGLVKFGSPGDEFDPRLHEALLHSHSPDVTTTTCQNIVTAGYKLGDRVVRPARVTVVDPVEEAPDRTADASQPASGTEAESATSGTGPDTSSDTGAGPHGGEPGGTPGS